MVFALEGVSFPSPPLFLHDCLFVGRDGGGMEVKDGPGLPEAADVACYVAWEAEIWALGSEVRD